MFSLFIFRAIGLKQQRDHMRAMGQFVPDSDDEEGQEEQQVKQIGHHIFFCYFFLSLLNFGSSQTGAGILISKYCF